MTSHRGLAAVRLVAAVCAAVLASSAVASAQPDLQVLHSFLSLEGEPDASLIEASDGNFYGTTSFTGMSGYEGTVFRMTPTGQVTVLHAFHGSAFDLTDGGTPVAPLIEATDGWLYGTTSRGGAFNKGTVFRISKAGAYSILHSFAGGLTDGEYPTAGLLQAADGNFYGTTVYGGNSWGGGTIFRMTPDGTVNVLHAFEGIPDHGARPYGPLVQASDGSFLGTTVEGGTWNAGTVFRLTPAGTLTSLHDFGWWFNNDGAQPMSGLLRGSDGNFYGTTSIGGRNESNPPDAGVIFRITPAGGYDVLHVFTGRPSEGSHPRGSLIEGSDGNFYGTTDRGGPTDGGTLFRMTPDGDVTTLHTFDLFERTGGFFPKAGLVQAADGNLYGTTEWGSVTGSGNGTAFRFTLTAKAVVALPVPGSTLTASSVTFGWKESAEASAYWLEIGTVAGGHDIFGQNVGLVTSQPVSGLPAFGEKVYVRLWTQLSGGWRYNDYIYTGYDARAVMTSPMQWATFTGSSTTFVWNGGNGASEYWLEVGTSPGARNLFEQSAGLATSLTVTGLPLTGGSVYVRLWTRVNSRWAFNDYSYFAANIARAEMTSPSPWTTLAGSSVTFNWSAGSGASQYWLDVGTSFGQGNLFSQGNGAATSRTVSGLPVDGRQIYVRLWTQANGAWLYNDYTYIAFNATATMTSPLPWTTFTGSSVTFNWTTGTGATEYWLEVGTGAGKGDLFSQSIGTGTSRQVTGLPVAGNTIYVRLWTQRGSSWLFNDYTYIAFNAKAAMISPTPWSTFTGSSVTFNWTAGTGATEYWLEVGTAVGKSDIFGQSAGLTANQTVSGIPLNGIAIYVRLWSRINGAWLFNDYNYYALRGTASMTSPTPLSTFGGLSASFVWSPGTGATSYWLDVGTLPGGSNIFSQGVGLATSQTVSGLPVTGVPIYVRLWTQLGGSWLYRDYQYYSFIGKAVITSPVVGPVLTQSTVLFQWGAIAGASEYWLEVGTTPGLFNVFTRSTGTSTSQLVAGIPTNAAAIYVRLWTRLGGIWQYSDATYGGHVIMFGGGSFSGWLFTTYSESTFTVNTGSLPWALIGEPSEYVAFWSGPGVTSTGELTVVPTQTQFHFNSIDIYSQATSIPYQITGTGPGGTVFTLSGIVPNPSGGFVHLTNPYASSPIDQLSIQLTNTSPACCSNYVGVDNIQVSY